MYVFGKAGKTREMQQMEQSMEGPLALAISMFVQSVSL